MACNAELQKPTRGQYVEVFGLQSNAGRLLNRQKGMVIKTNEATGRIEVCLGAEGKIASLKPECLRLVAGASAEEIQDAKDVAGPALRAAAQEAGEQQVNDSTADTETPQPQERERSRSWSPPPEAVRAAAAAAQQASSWAIGRGMTSEQAEELGSAAAEQSLARAKQAASEQTHASSNNAAQASGDPVPSGATNSEKLQKSLEHLKVGDEVKVVGLKGAEADLNGLDALIQDFQGFGGPRNRKYVVSLTKLVINDAGDLAEQKRVLTLSSKNIRLPGDGTVEVEATHSSDEAEATKKKPTSKKRSRSRRRRRRRRSSSSSSSSSSAKRKRAAMYAKREPRPEMTKAERLQRMGIRPVVQQRRQW